MRNRRLLVALAVLCGLVSSRPAPASSHPLTIEDRIEAQRAIEAVYWSYRIWPPENHTPKPPLSAVMSDAALRSRVEDYLRKSNALAAVWGRPITSRQLQAEMERMARETRASDVLSELFAALGNDPVLIAETLVRQKLVDRRLRDAYAYDERFHGRVKRSAEGALSRVKRVADLKTLGGEYRETTWRLSDGTDARVGRDHLGDDGRTTVTLDREKWDRHLRELAGRIHAPAGSARWSRLEETADAFTVTAILSEAPAADTTATVSWPKESFDAWWSKERSTLGKSLAEGVGTYTAVQPRGTACMDDTWRKTFDGNIPDARGFNTTVWTGTEMIVWGGLIGSTPVSTGGRYDPSTDTWAPTSTGAGVPQGRGGHTAVWTGTKMIVWGGSEIEPYNPGSTMNTGGLYDLLTDTWEPTSTGAGVPQGRANHTAVWTGSRMIVWGGTDLHPLNSGGRYDPSTNTWASTSIGAGVPSARPNHTAVWTGTKMIVWGGGDLAPFTNTGGRYDPSTDTWAATSTGASVPASRAYHTAIWTGTQMIVWGGLGGALDGLNTGGRYDPSTNTWAATSTGAGVPQGRGGHTAVWTGSRMIVWGGYDADTFNSGGRYDPSTNTWAATSTGAGVPRSRGGHTAVWTGTEMIVWGGSGSFGSLNSGGRYDPATDTWAATSAGTGIPTGRAYGTAVWTGAEMIVWGGYDGRSVNTGGRYDPATDTWAATSTGASVPASRLYQTAVWTGTDMIVWGGYDDAYQGLSTGGRYNPSLDAWTATSSGAGVPSNRAFHTAVWSGTEMIVWGGGVEDCCGSVYTNTGGRYDPSSDTWTATSAGGPSPRGFHTAIWTGTKMIVWGGSDGSNYVNTGGLYDPSTNTWAATSTGAGVPSSRGYHTAVWTGAEMIVWGGDDVVGLQNTGGRYEPLTNTWAATSIATGVPSARARDTAVWTGREMIVWGGDAGNSSFSTGGRYDPSLDTWTPTSAGAGVPSDRAVHTAVWTGTEMIVWGGDPISSRGGRYCASVSCTGSPTMCDDGNACNGVETCDPVAGCISGTPVICGPPDQCQVGVCAPGTGVCSYSNRPDGSTCDDGNPSTCADTCRNGGCTGASCKAECSGAPDGTACSDGNSCTTGDQCRSGKCVAPAAFVQPAGSPIGVAVYPFNAEAGDFNRDGKPDLVAIGYTSHKFTVLLGNGAGGFAQPPGSPVPTIGTGEQTLTTADFNVDGNLDVAVAHGGLVSIYLGNGAGGFTPVGSGFPTGSGIGHLVAGDFNRDGKPDLIGIDAGPRNIRVLLGNGLGGFSEAPGSPVSAGNGPGLAVSDFNLDGKLDIAEGDIGSISESVIILLGDGTGGFTPAPSVPVASSAHEFLAVGDFNLDGRPDLATSGQLYVTLLLGDGHGGFGADVVLMGSGGGHFTAVAVGDFNVDHKPDLAVLNYGTAAFSILLGDGFGGFAELNDPSFGPVSDPISAPVADFNLDGKDDLAVANFSSSTIGIFLNSHAVLPDGSVCDDGSACTLNDVCADGACVGGAAPNCDDGNACTSDSCDTSLGCVNTPIACDNGNFCDGVETCDPTIGCIAGTPVVCAPPDQCHVAGVCNPGTGVCGYGQLPNGTICDDGNAGTTGDACVGGVCTGSTCASEPKPKSSGYYQKLCKAGLPKPSHSDALTDADAACVGQLTSTFAGTTTATDICVVFQNQNSHDSNGPDCKECEKAEDELMALALNICRNNVCESQEVDSACGADHDSHHRVLTTVGASLDAADDILSDPARSKDTCKDATCLAKEINNGKGIHHVSLALTKISGGRIGLTWSDPVMDDGSGGGQKYTVWRRTLTADDSFVKVAETTNLTWVDADPDTTSWEYEVTFTVQP